MPATCRLGKIVVAAFVFCMVLAASVAEEKDVEVDAADAKSCADRYRWQSIWMRFNAAGRLVADEQFQAAADQLQAIVDHGDTPYDRIANKHLDELTSIMRTVADGGKRTSDASTDTSDRVVANAVSNSQRPGKKSSKSQSDEMANQARRNAQYCDAIWRLCFRLGAYRDAMPWRRKSHSLYRASQHADDLLMVLRVGGPGLGQTYLENCLAATPKDEPTRRDKIREQLGCVSEYAEDRDDPLRLVQLIETVYLNNSHDGQRISSHLFPALVQLEQIREILDTADPLEESFPITRVLRLIITCLKSLGDEAGALAWQQHLFDYESTQYQRKAIAAHDRARRAFGRRHFSESLKYYRLICSEYQQSKLYGVAQFNVGYVLLQQKKYDDSIAEFRKLFHANVDDREPAPGIMTMFQNYHHRAARSISRCYEGKNEFDHALRWELDARDKYKYQSWCGTCSGQTAKAITSRLMHLYIKANRRDDAVKMLFDTLRDVHRSSSLDDEAVTFLVDEYERRGKLDELERRIESVRQRRLADLITQYPQDEEVLKKHSMTSPMVDVLLRIDERRASP